MESADDQLAESLALRIAALQGVIGSRLRATMGLSPDVYIPEDFLESAETEIV